MLTQLESMAILQVEKALPAMYKRMQKHLTSEELLPSLWEKFKVRSVVILS